MSKRLKINEEENNMLPTKWEKESGPITLKTDESSQSIGLWNALMHFSMHALHVPNASMFLSICIFFIKTIVSYAYAWPRP